MIPNNIGLSGNPRLERQLTHYQSKFRKWWDRSGPLEYRDVPIYLRCPTGLTDRNWAEFKYVRPNDYQWGIFVTRRQSDSIAFGAARGERVWNTPPDVYRNYLLEHIRMQADAEPGSVEQSRALTRTAPSLYDLRNLYQFLLEEARHLWAMTHVLLEHFGHDGEVESEALLERASGDGASPRLLDAFNFRTSDWLAHFVWCFLADRDGKYQLDAVCESAFAPLGASAGFILQEEHFHLAIGSSGIERVLRRSAEVTRAHETDDIFEHGAIPVSVVQKYLNFWAPKVYDLFGNDESRRASEMYEIGVRGPAYVAANPNEPVVIDRRGSDGLVQVEVTAELAINAVMRRRYIKEVEMILGRFNDMLASYGIDARLTMPHERFHRSIGPCKGLAFDLAGNPIDPAASDAYLAAHLPSDAELRSVEALMRPVRAPDEVAGWLAPPRLLVGVPGTAHKVDYLLF
jgi:benzoyl-CoA 2,3-dioxygenase component B